MIGKYVQSYCVEDISLIENYEEAISSEEMYECHHRREEDGYTYKDLMEMNLYFQRPAEELIFLKEADHKNLHQKGRIKSESERENISKSKLGALDPMYGKASWNRGLRKERPVIEKKEYNGPWNKGKKNVYSEESLKRMSESKKEYYKHHKKIVSKETREKMSKSLKGKHWYKDPVTGKHIYE